MKKCFHVTAVASPMQQPTRCWFRVSADEHQLNFSIRAAFCYRLCDYF